MRGLVYVDECCIYISTDTEKKEREIDAENLSKMPPCGVARVSGTRQGRRGSDQSPASSTKEHRWVAPDPELTGHPAKAVISDTILSRA